MKHPINLAVIMSLLFSCKINETKTKFSNPLIYENEVNFKNMRQLTFEGEKRRSLLEF